MATPALFLVFGDVEDHLFPFKGIGKWFPAFLLPGVRCDRCFRVRFTGVIDEFLARLIKQLELIRILLLLAGTTEETAFERVELSGERIVFHLQLLPLGFVGELKLVLLGNRLFVGVGHRGELLFQLGNPVRTHAVQCSHSLRKCLGSF